MSSGMSEKLKAADKASQASAVAEAPVQTDAQVMAAKIAELERANAELIRENEALVSKQELSSQRPTRKEELAFRGDNGGYKFRVGPKKHTPGLKTEEITCCDESEAKRWYVLTHDHPDHPGKQMDPVADPLEVVCLEKKKRDDRIAEAKMISRLRQKRENGIPMTVEEEETLNEAEQRESTRFQA